MKNHHRSSASSLRIQWLGAGAACIGNSSYSSPAESPQHALTGRRQNASLPTDARWTYYTTFASPIKAATAFGVRDIEQARTNDYQRVRVKRTLRRA